MIIEELYINGILVDLPRNFSIRLNRQLLNPAELNTKDAQFSYSISLPPSDTVHRAFKYANIEETRDKFNRQHTAELIVNGVLIFSGYIRLTNIDTSGYKGNLYLPAPETVKDIFGDIPLNETPEFRIPFSDFATSITAINQAAKTAIQPAIFPFALYGVLPKVPLDRDANNYSAREVWDDSVHLGMSDIPPSLNLLTTLKHIFNSRGYSLQGTAFDDERLAKIYFSYKNDSDYVQPWNYGYHAKIQLNGEWSSFQNARTNNSANLEKGANQSYDALGFAVYSTDLFDAVNSKINITEDTGGNVLLKEVQDSDGDVWTQCQVRLPVSGFYKVTFNASVRVNQSENNRRTNPYTGFSHISGRSSNSNNNFNNNMYEVKLLRDRGGADFGLSGAKIDGRFYYDNLPQNTVFTEENTPKYFPQVFESQKVLVDLAQNKNLLTGIHFGRSAQAGRVDRTPFINPRDASTLAPMVLAAKPAISWNAQEDTERTLLAMDSPGYWKFGRVNVFGDDEDNPNLNIDYSEATRVVGQVFDNNGNPQPPSADNLGVRFSGYFLNSITGFMQPLSGWETSDYIDLSTFTDVRFSATVPASSTAAVVAYFDGSRQYIGYGVLADVENTLNFNNEAIIPPALARYARLSARVNTLQITGVNVVSENVIMRRFPLDRFFTYRLTAPGNVNGRIYIHNGDDLDYIFSVNMVDGLAEFNTNLYPYLEFEPRLSMYLKTAEYNIDGSLIISRIIDDESDDTIDWELTNRYRINLMNAPESYARRGQYDGAVANELWDGQGEVNSVIWLEAGELISVASVSSEGRYRRSAQHSKYGWVDHRVKWNLSIQPFRIEKDWLKVNLQGTGTAPMNWNDPVNFDTDSINLMGFLSAEMKSNDFIDNVVKAFNLRLSQLEPGVFSLDVKQTRASLSSRSIDIDGSASVRQRANTPLNLPSLYRLGFTVDTEEEGYFQTQDDGGGEYPTGSVEGGVIEQKSTFSYNWFKNIQKGNVTLPLPVISKHEVWEPAMPYPDAMAKRFTDLGYRFWYFDGLLNDLGTSFTFNGVNMSLAKVSNTLQNLNILNYKNQQNTILDNYFTLLINGSSHYTEVDVHLTAAQYAFFNGSVYIKFNGDLYYLAEIKGYDPSNRNKTRLRLIRRI